MSVSPTPVKQKWKTTALILKYKYLIHNRFQVIPHNCFKHIQVSKFLYRNNLMSAKSLQTNLGCIHFFPDIYYYFYYLPKLFAKMETRSKKVKSFAISP